MGSKARWLRIEKVDRKVEVLSNRKLKEHVCRVATHRSTTAAASFFAALRTCEEIRHPAGIAAHLLLNAVLAVNNHPKSLLRYRDEDRELYEVEELSRRAQVSRAFIRLCVTLGCPTSGGKLSQSMMLEWLFNHYEQVREAAGLKPVPPIEGVSGEALLKLMMGNAMITLLEYSEVRSSQRIEKRQLRQVRKMVEQTLERV